MELRSEKKEIRRWVHLPDFFVTDKLEGLTFPAVKLYLNLCLSLENGEGQFDEKSYCQLVHTDSKGFSEALSLLIRQGLIRTSEDQIEILDLTKQAAEKQSFQEATASQVSRQQEEKLLERREEIIRQINDRFFQGMMPASFFREIDQWFTQYGFEPEVVYTLISEVADYNKLASPGYASTIARSWSQNGVRTYSDLMTHYEQSKRQHSLYEQVRKKLRMKEPLNEFQQEFVDRWVQEWGFPEEVVHEAIRIASRKTEITFPYIESVLKKWHEAGRHTLEEVHQFQLDYQQESGQRAANRRAKLNSSRNAGFDQRRYSKQQTRLLYQIPGAQRPLSQKNGKGEVLSGSVNEEAHVDRAMEGQENR